MLRAEQDERRAQRTVVGARARPQSAPLGRSGGGGPTGSGGDAGSKKKQPAASAPAAPEIADEGHASFSAWAQAGPLLRYLPCAARGDDGEDDEGQAGETWAAPTALAIDARRGTIAVADRSVVRVYKWLPKVQLWLHRLTIDDQRQPSALAFAGDGELVVANGSSLVIFDYRSKMTLRTIGGGGRGGLKAFTAVAANAEKVAAFDAHLEQLLVYNLVTGSLLRCLSLPGISVAAGGLSIGFATGQVAVLEQRIEEPEGSPLRAKLRVYRLFDSSCVWQLSADRLLQRPSTISHSHGHFLVAGVASNDSCAEDGAGVSIQVIDNKGHCVREVSVGRGAMACGRCVSI